ncbi:MAG: ribosome maturation factor RimM [Hyphomicrobiaceae bacterium]
MTSASDNPDRIRVGHIAGPHGIRGEVLIKSYTAVPEDIASYGPLETQTGDTIVIRKCRAASKGIVAALDGITSRNAAEALKGAQLHVARDKLPDTDEEEWYVADLIGLSVEDEDGLKIGTVLTVHDFGAGELLELELAGRPQSLLIPFTRETIPDIRIDEQRLTVHLTPDLLDDEAEREDDT